MLLIRNVYEVLPPLSLQLQSFGFRVDWNMYFELIDIRALAFRIEEPIDPHSSPDRESNGQRRYLNAHLSKWPLHDKTLFQCS